MRTLSKAPANPLSVHEQAVYDLLLAGKDEQEVAAELHLAPGEAEKTTKALCKRFAVKDRPQLIAKAYQNLLKMFAEVFTLKAGPV